MLTFQPRRCRISTDYRPDIDGLRALAILPVVWFHSGLPGLPGGFTGVDTFFVISGYLITSLIHREVSDGGFSFAKFYERRVRRIAPALLTVLATTLIVGSVLLLPDELIKLGYASFAAIGMVANVFFWREGGYFGMAEGVTPLLHTWSLGVEEQFYLLFPVLLIVAEKFRMVRSTVLALAISSFAICVIGTALAPAASFYLLPTRAWELMLGALLAVGALRIPIAMRSVAALAGAVLIAAALVFITEKSAFPGWLAAVPAVGAMLLIGSGPETLVNRAIANSLFVAVGKISYSLYLWHWPVFVFARHYRADLVLPAGWALASILLSTLLAWGTYRWIEQPARRSSMPYRRVALLTGGGAAAIVAIVLVVSMSGGFPARFDHRVLELAGRKDDLAPLAHSCVNTPLQQIDIDCRLGRKGQPHYIVWGDSHAAAESEGIALGLPHMSGVLASFNTCAPTLGWTSPDLVGRDGAVCAARNAEVLKRVLADDNIATVVLAAYWPSHARSGAGAMWRSVRELVARLNAGGKRVIIIAGTPEASSNSPWANAIRSRFKRNSPPLNCVRPRIPIQNVTVADVSPWFCADRHPEQLFTDGNHPSRTAGARVIAPAIASLKMDDPPL